jgi:hydroxyethylthiazole kinase-like uncharacterized protein yjeF
LGKKAEKMQKLFRDCYDLDKKCYDKYGLSEDILMEHAATAIEQLIRNKFESGSSVLIVCGSGNNGADGITLARLLYGDYKVRLFMPFGAKSEMAKLQLQRAKMLRVSPVKKLKESDIIVDALFGAGLNRELNSQSVGIIDTLNSFDGYKIACDIPSGLSKEGSPTPVAFRADCTVTMGALKEALFLDAAKDYVGEVEVANLGISRDLYEGESSTYLLEKSDFRAPFREKKDCHKGSFGHVAVFAGEKEGAAIIAAMAATRFGAGLTTVVNNRDFVIPPYLMHANSVPKNATAIAIGMGLGNCFDDEIFTKEVIKSSAPIVLDADALSNKKLLSVLKQKREIVVTPHPKEFQRLLKLLMGVEMSVAEIQKKRFELAREFTLQFPSVTLLLKGANPIIAHTGKLYVNPHGSHVLAKGGSGDVLSGLIAALLAQGYSSISAAINGSLALALASAAYSKKSYYLLPTDIIELLGELI